MVGAVPEAVQFTAAEIRGEGLDHDIVDRLEEALVNHSEYCLGLLV